MRETIQRWTIGLSVVALLSSCSATTQMVSMIRPAGDPASAQASEEAQSDEELTQFISMMRHDLTSYRTRERDRNAVMPPQNAALNRSATPASPSSFGTASAAISFIRMPVMGVTTDDISNSWGDPRDGGKRRHKGIDIFAPKGTPVVAVTDGYISYIGNQPKGGLCLWLTSNDGMSFYYAHLDRWAAGLYEGQEVRTGDTLGFVGNTGNAAHTPSHLHFSVVDNDESVNPYTVLKFGRASGRAVLTGGFSRGAAQSSVNR